MFDEYVQYGGFPLVGISSFDTKSAYQIVDGIYASVITRDISKRHKIRNKELFDRAALGNDNGIEIVHIADFLMREKW